MACPISLFASFSSRMSWNIIYSGCQSIYTYSYDGLYLRSGVSHPKTQATESWTTARFQIYNHAHAHMCASQDVTYLKCNHGPTLPYQVKCVLESNPDTFNAPIPTLRFFGVERKATYLTYLLAPLLMTCAAVCMCLVKVS